MATDAGSDLPVAVSCMELAALTGRLDATRLLLIDLRSRRRYGREHIAGSHSIPRGLLLSGEHPDGELILISEQPQEAAAVIEALHADGYHHRLHYLAEGLAGWREQGLPVQSDPGSRPVAPLGVLLQGLAGVALLSGASLLTPITLFSLGILLRWQAWLELPLPGQTRHQRWT